MNEISGEELDLMLNDLYEFYYNFIALRYSDYVDALKESESGEGAYFYTSFENPETFQSFDMGFNVRMNADDSLFVGSKSKLYPILSYATGIDGGIVCDDFEDIRTALEGLTFKAATKREKFGNKKYFIIYP